MLAALCLAGCSQSTDEAPETPEGPFSQVDWDAYKSAHVSGGRVIDGPSGNVSHSEGQGFGMVLAVAASDRETFADLWQWSKDILRPARQDGLFAWRWNPKANAVDDANNATDGDILIAWALFLADEKWDVPEYRSEALAIIKALRTSMIRQTPIGPVLLPAGQGYEQSIEIVVNPSYWVFPAIDYFSRVDSAPSVWLDLAATGIRLLEGARFGRFELPGDWVAVASDTGEVRLPTGEQFSREFGYNAIRVPLYLIWSGYRQESLFYPYLEFAGLGTLPASIDLVSDQPGVDPAMPGGLSVFQLTRDVISPDTAGGSKAPALVEGDAYYSASLHLLAELARQTTTLH